MVTIRYPNGKKFTSIKPENKHVQKTSYSNRGMTLEEDLNVTNEYYLANGVAIIHKKPTPLQIVKVDYPTRSAAVVKEAYFKQPSTTDYNGIFRGRYLDFEAKESRNKTSFPLKNFHQHQIDHMNQVCKHGGICFVILKFTVTNEVFLFDAIHLIDYWKQQQTGRKSIPKPYIEQVGHMIPIGFHPRIDYLQVADHIYFDSR